MQQRRRSGLISGLVALGLLAGVALAAGPAPAAEGPGLSFADRAWNRKLPAGPRFLVQTDWNSEVVLDRETGLVWERSPAVTRHTWFGARFHCANRTTGGRRGWRLPSVHELNSLVDPSVAPLNPTLPVGHPFTTVQSDDYWSATEIVPDPITTNNAWGVDFLHGEVGGEGNNPNKNNEIFAWCVRGGMNADAY